MFHRLISLGNSAGFKYKENKPENNITNINAINASFGKRR